MYIYKWIEGENNLDEYCIKRFGERPAFIEHHGSVGNSKIWKLEKFRKDKGHYTSMFLLYMEIEEVDKAYHFSEFEKIKSMDYENIRFDRTAILKQ